VVQLTRAGTVVRAGAHEVNRLREEFARRQCIRLPQFIERQRAEALVDAIERSEFFERVHPNCGTTPPVDQCLRNDRILGELSFLVNDRSLLALIQELTGYRVGSFLGAVYRLEPGRGYDTWHDDVGRQRVLAMSINLSRGVYSGGVLQLREAETGRLLHETSNTGLGDAVLFRIAPNLQHRVTDVVGPFARTAFAGWFASEPDFMTLLTGRSGTAAGDARP
jgi:hypothetical protein